MWKVDKTALPCFFRVDSHGSQDYKSRGLFLLCTCAPFSGVYCPVVEHVEEWGCRRQHVFLNCWHSSPRREKTRKTRKEQMRQTKRTNTKAWRRKEGRKEPPYISGWDTKRTPRKYGLIIYPPIHSSIHPSIFPPVSYTHLTLPTICSV